MRVGARVSSRFKVEVRIRASVRAGQVDAQGVIKTPSCLRFKDSRSLMGSESYVMVT